MTAAVSPAARRGRAGVLLWPTLGTLVAACILVALGVWQLQRLAWKTELLDTIAARTTMAPEPLPLSDRWTTLDPAAYAYRHVTLSGTFDHAAEVRVFRPLAQPRGHYGGLGDLILTPFRLSTGGTIIVNRGFVPEDRADAGTRAAGQIAGPVTITGLMREPEARNPFTPADDPTARLWFTRDAASIAAALGLGPVAPFTIDQDASEVPGGLPQGGETILDIPNNHLSYALTWFGLAVGLLGVYAVSVWRARFSRQPGSPRGELATRGDVVERRDET